MKISALLTTSLFILVFIGLLSNAHAADSGNADSAASGSAKSSPSPSYNSTSTQSITWEQGLKETAALADLKPLEELFKITESKDGDIPFTVTQAGKVIILKGTVTSDNADVLAQIKKLYANVIISVTVKDKVRPKASLAMLNNAVRFNVQLNERGAPAVRLLLDNNTKPTLLAAHVAGRSTLGQNTAPFLRLTEIGECNCNSHDFHEWILELGASNGVTDKSFQVADGIENLQFSKALPIVIGSRTGATGKMILQLQKENYNEPTNSLNNNVQLKAPPLLQIGDGTGAKATFTFGAHHKLILKVNDEKGSAYDKIPEITVLPGDPSDDVSGITVTPKTDSFLAFLKIEVTKPGIGFFDPVSPSLIISGANSHNVRFNGAVLKGYTKPNVLISGNHENYVSVFNPEEGDELVLTSNDKKFQTIFRFEHKSSHEKTSEANRNVGVFSVSIDSDPKITMSNLVAKIAQNNFLKFEIDSQTKQENPRFDVMHDLETKIESATFLIPMN